jgi:hypothetical protein
MGLVPMNIGQAQEMKWFFGFRQTSPSPPGRWIAEGPFDSYDRAKLEREGAKAWDAEVSTPFAAKTKAEAQAKCDSGRGF